MRGYVYLDRGLQARREGPTGIAVTAWATASRDTWSLVHIVDRDYNNRGGDMVQGYVRGWTRNDDVAI